MNTAPDAQQIDTFMSMLLTPGGVLVLCIVPLVIVATLGLRSVRWTVLGAAMWLSTFGIILPLPWFKSKLTFPLEQIRSVAKPSATALLVLLIPAALFSGGGWRQKRVQAVSVAYFIFLLIISMRTLTSGAVGRGYAQVLTYFVTFLVFGIGLTRWLQSLEDVRRALKCITWAGVLLTVCSLYQVVVDSKQIVLVSRLFGMTSNPQFLGSILGLCLAPTLYLLMEARESKLWRIVLAAALGFMIVCIVWAGSRTGVLISVINIVLFFRLRVGRLTVGLVIGAASLWVALQFFTEGFAGAERLLSTEDTRTAAWKSMLYAFMRNPFLGSIGEGAGFQENTYLAVASQFGLLGVIPGMVVLVLALQMVKGLVWSRTALGKAGALSDLMFAGLMSFAVASLFDAYPLATIGFHVFFLYTYFAISGLLLDLAQHAPATLPLGTSAELQQQPMEVPEQLLPEPRGSWMGSA